MPRTPHLTPNQYRVLTLLSSGATATAAAQAVGVHRNTIGNWLRSSIFRDALDEIRREHHLAWREQTRSLAMPSPEKTNAPLPAPPPKPVSVTPKPGRNQPCPCGSGRKFKRCCISRY